MQTLHVASKAICCQLQAVQAPRLAVQALVNKRRGARSLKMLAMSSKAQTAVDETDAGAFKRTDAEFRNWIQSDSDFAPEGTVLAARTAVQNMRRLLNSVCGLSWTIPPVHLICLSLGLPLPHLLVLEGDSSWHCNASLHQALSAYLTMTLKSS